MCRSWGDVKLKPWMFTSPINRNHCFPILESIFQPSERRRSSNLERCQLICSNTSLMEWINTRASVGRQVRNRSSLVFAGACIYTLCIFCIWRHIPACSEIRQMALNINSHQTPLLGVEKSSLRHICCSLIVSIAQEKKNLIKQNLPSAQGENLPNWRTDTLHT